VCFTPIDKNYGVKHHKRQSLFSSARRAQRREHLLHPGHGVGGITGWRRWLANILLIIFVAPPVMFIGYRYIPPFITPLMIIRSAEGFGLTRHWVPLSEISPNLQRAVIASEDARFCLHHGFDWVAVHKAIERNAEGGHRLLGASTISMQTAKNLLLWPGRDYLRKGAEAYLTMWLEMFVPKKRILELYLNEIEWGQGIYGAEAAARIYFNTSAAKLTPRQASLMAAVLPNPLGWRPDYPGRWVSEHARTIEGRMNAVFLGKDGPCP